MSAKTLLKKIVIYLIGLSLVLGLRGMYLSRLVEGRYSWISLIEDVFFLVLVMAACHLVYFVLNGLLSPIEKIGFWYKAGAGVLRVSFIVLLVFPALLSYIQIHPQKIAPVYTPKKIGLEFENVVLYSDGINLQGWFIPSSLTNRGAVLLLHGLNANKQNFLYAAKLLHEMDLSVLVFDLRSHGESGGRTFTFGIKESADVKVGYDWLRSRYPELPIYGIGYSAGGAALLQAAAKYGIFNKIVLDSTFASVERMAKKSFLQALGPVKGIAWCSGRFWAYIWTGVDFAAYDGLKDIKKIKSKDVFLIHGLADKVIPVEESKLLAESLGLEANTWFIEGADHLQGLGNFDYSIRLRKFFGF